jgi:nucleoside-diphosphate-sugar epimerase
VKAFVTGGSGFLGRNLLRTLHERGDEARALARSDGSAKVVEDLGATAIRGDLTDLDALTSGAEGVDVIFHCAAYVKTWGDEEEARRITVGGTERVLEAARKTGARVVHVSTEAVLADGQGLYDADETTPYPTKPSGLYPRTKGEAERKVVAAAKDGVDACIVRPRGIWGNDDSVLLPQLVEAVQTGRFKWIDGGEPLTSTCHVDNVVEGMLAAAERGKAGEIYFLTDGENHTYREWFGRMLETRGVEPPKAVVPLWVARLGANTAELLWRALPLPGDPPLNRTEVALMGVQMTVSDDKARRELGYQGRVGFEEGIASLST